MLKQAIVNGQPISREAVQFELDRLLKFYASHGMSKEDLTKNLPKLAERAQEQAIGAKLLLDRATQLDIKVTDEELDEQVEKVVEQVGGRDNFIKALAAQKISEDDFRKELAKGCRVDALVRKACSEVPEPCDHEVADYYEKHRAEYVAAPEVFCRHILVKTEGLDSGDKAQALEKIKSIRADVVGADNVRDAFIAAAKEHSDCPSSAEGGSLGWFGRGMMVPEFDAASFSMKKNEVSDVIETQFGYHIILKEDERGGGMLNLVDVHDQIRDLLRHEARGRAMDAYVAELREKAKIEYK